MTDRDLLALRELTDDHAEVPDEAVSRVWYELSRRQRIAVRPARRPLLVILTSAAAVTAVLLGVGVAVNWRQPAKRPTVSTAASTPAKGRPSSVAPGGSATPWTALDTSGGRAAGTTIPLAPAVSTLVAAAGSVQPLALAPGQYLYEQGDLGDAHPDQSWLSSNVRLQVAVRQGLVIHEAGEPAGGPPTIDNPTTAWMATWPTQPAALLAFLSHLIAPGGVSGTKHPVNREIWSHVEDMLMFADPLVPTAQRQALYGVLGMLQHMSARQLTIGGRPLIAIRETDGHTGDELLCDPATGLVAGARTVWLGPDSPDAAHNSVTWLSLFRWAAADTLLAVPMAPWQG